MASTPSPITLTIRFLARYAEVAGRDSLTLEVPPASTVAQVLALLAADPRVRGALPSKPLCALNFAQVRGDHGLSDGDELALLPPMAGG